MVRSDFLLSLLGAQTLRRHSLSLSLIVCIYGRKSDVGGAHGSLCAPSADGVILYSSPVEGWNFYSARIVVFCVSRIATLS